MHIKVSRFRACDMNSVFAIQRAAFQPLYEKYHDDDSSPYLETKQTVFRKYTKADTVGYVFRLDDTVVGAVRIHTDDKNRTGRVSALCVLPQYQGKGIAQTALLEIERLHPNIERWFLDTILEEPGNCHLYEKIGYQKTGKTEETPESRLEFFVPEVTV